MNPDQNVERLRLAALVTEANRLYGLAITMYARGQADRAEMDARRDSAHAKRRALAAFIRST